MRSSSPFQLSPWITRAMLQYNHHIAPACGVEGGARSGEDYFRLFVDSYDIHVSDWHAVNQYFRHVMYKTRSKAGVPV